jgi:hypothetical protein
VTTTNTLALSWGWPLETFGTGDVDDAVAAGGLLFAAGSEGSDGPGGPPGSSKDDSKPWEPPPPSAPAKVPPPAPPPPPAPASPSGATGPTPRGAPGAAAPAAPAGSPPGEPGAPAPPPAKPTGFLGRVRAFFKRHGRKLWWVHSCYALGLGIAVMLLAQKGSEYFRWLAIFLGGAWLMFLLFFRIFRSGAQRKVGGAAAKVAFVAMNYLMKDMYQAMLFFLLPFYWRSSTWGASNYWFAIGLGVCALLATLDVVFDHYVMRWRVLASLYYLVALFACLNLLIPALLPAVHVLWALLAAAGVSAFVFLTLHIRLRYLVTRAGLLISVIVMAAAMLGAWAGRRAVPPVPYYTTRAVAGAVRPRGDPVATVRAAELEQVVAITDVVSPIGGVEPFRHVWRRAGKVVASVEPLSSRLPGAQVALQLSTRLPPAKLPAERTGGWTVDLETTDGRLIGRAKFDVQP